MWQTGAQFWEKTDIVISFVAAIWKNTGHFSKYSNAVCYSCTDTQLIIIFMHAFKRIVCPLQLNLWKSDYPSLVVQPKLKSFQVCGLVVLALNLNLTSWYIADTGASGQQKNTGNTKNISIILPNFSSSSAENVDVLLSLWCKGKELDGQLFQGPVTTWSRLLLYQHPHLIASICSTVWRDLVLCWMMAFQPIKAL